MEAPGRKGFSIVFSLLVLFLFGYMSFKIFKQPATDSESTEMATSTQVLWGAYTGNSEESMWAFEELIGSKMPIHVMFWGWDEIFPESEAGAEGKTLLLFWEPAFGYKDIVNGKQDAYIKKFAQGAKAYGYLIILAPFDEFNLNESAWGNGVGDNTPQSFIAAWRKVRTIFREENVGNVQFALVYNNDTIPKGSFASFYPGDEYVDIVGVDGFNFDTKTFPEIFDRALLEAKALGTKPVWITSTGSIWPQNDFIKNFGKTGLPWIWFNEAPFDVKADALADFTAIAPSFSTSTAILPR